MTDSVGFIGLGIMGAPMVRNLLGAGFEVRVWNRTVARSEEAATHGASIGASPADVAANSDIVISCVTASEDVENVLLGTEGVDGAIEGVRSGSVVIDMSTISPAVTRDIGARLAEKNVALLDAPISGGEQGAIDGTLSIMVGGEAEALERVRPILEAMGSRITH